MEISYTLQWHSVSTNRDWNPSPTNHRQIVYNQKINFTFAVIVWNFTQRPAFYRRVLDAAFGDENYRKRSFVATNIYDRFKQNHLHIALHFK